MKETVAIETADILQLHNAVGSFKVVVFNVGQGDHILIKLPNNEYGIIDFYYNGSENVLEPPALSYFKVLKQKLEPAEFQKITISFFCISHTDKDHVKGINEVIEWFDNAKIFIRECWLTAAREQRQLMNFLQDKVDALLDSVDDPKYIVEHIKKIDYFKDNVQSFFTSFENWKSQRFLSPRYKTEEFGRGEYLVDIRQLNFPCQEVEALNIGPLGHHIDEYINSANFENIKKLMGLNDENCTLDKNSLSHILQFTFKNTKLLFGGDTEKYVWEDCIKRYMNPQNKFLKHFGDIKSNFIKVSHHGSRHSSSQFIWENILCDNGIPNLAISAGRHKGYLHPHSETIDEIKQVRKNAVIYSTNICHTCITKEDTIEREVHKWYDKYIENAKKYESSGESAENGEISKIFDLTFDPSSIKKDYFSEAGLFAYIFDISGNGNIKTTIALSETTRPYSCFFSNHSVKLTKRCYDSATSYPAVQTN